MAVDKSHVSKILIYTLTKRKKARLSLPRKDIRTVSVPMQSGLARLFPASIWVQTDGETTSQIAMRALQWKLRIDGKVFIFETREKREEHNNDLKTHLQ